MWCQGVNRGLPCAMQAPCPPCYPAASSVVALNDEPLPAVPVVFLLGLHPAVLLDRPWFCAQESLLGTIRDAGSSLVRLCARQACQPLSHPSGPALPAILQRVGPLVPGSKIRACSQPLAHSPALSSSFVFVFVVWFRTIPGGAWRAPPSCVLGSPSRMRRLTPPVCSAFEL